MQGYRPARLVAPETRGGPSDPSCQRVGPQDGQLERAVAQEVGGRHQEVPGVDQDALVRHRGHGRGTRVRSDDRAER